MYLTTNMAATRVGVFMNGDPDAEVETNRQVSVQFFNIVFLTISSAVLELFHPCAYTNRQSNISLLKPTGYLMHQRGFF
jgi:hypothetical protein